MTNNPPSEWFRIFLILLFVIVLLIGLIGNGLVLLSVFTSHIQIRRSPTNLLLVNLSCADLIILIFNTFDVLQLSLDRSWPTAWHLGLPLCKIVRFAQVFGCYVSVQTLLIISIERYWSSVRSQTPIDLHCSRYVSIIHPIRLSRVRRRQRLRTLFVMIWLLGLLIASPNLYLLQLHLLDDRSSSYVCGLSDHWLHSHWITVYKYAESIVFFFLPAVIQVSVLRRIEQKAICLPDIPCWSANGRSAFFHQSRLEDALVGSLLSIPEQWAVGSLWKSRFSRLDCSLLYHLPENLLGRSSCTSASSLRGKCELQFSSRIRWSAVQCFNSDCANDESDAVVSCTLAMACLHFSDSSWKSGT